MPPTSVYLCMGYLLYFLLYVTSVCLAWKWGKEEGVFVTRYKIKADAHFVNNNGVTYMEGVTSPAPDAEVAALCEDSGDTVDMEKEAYTIDDDIMDDDLSEDISPEMMEGFKEYREHHPYAPFGPWRKAYESIDG